jgi:phosphatidate cytidylyltransferase
MTPFLSRVAVVAAGLPVVLATAWLGGWFLLALAAVAALLALHEFYGIARRFRPLVLAGYGGALAALAGAQVGGITWMVAGFSATLALAFLFGAVAHTRQSSTAAIAATVLGAGWVGLGLGYLLLIRDLDYGRDAILTVLVMVFVTDAFAYLGGRIVGRHKMTPVMSPGKTWEGFVIGAIAGLVAAFFALYETEYAGGWRSFVLGGAVVLSSTLGDLFESLVKRDLEVKDTGRLLAGHGGMLDRIDSLLFAGPAAYFTLLGLAEVTGG